MSTPDVSPHLTVLRAAHRYRELGLSFVPILPDGSKRPACRWAYLQYEPPWPFEVDNWFGSPFYVRGIAIVTGRVSGNLEVIDCDSKQVASAFVRKLNATNPRLLRRLVLVSSPRGGHLYYRCPEIGSCGKLARGPDPKQDNRSQKTLIDLKGEGGYVIAPPTPGICHPTGRPYLFATSRGFEQIAQITIEERETLLAIARSQNTGIAPPAARPQVVPKAERSDLTPTSSRPGEDFNHRADWSEILMPHGWQVVQKIKCVTYWRRPEKTEGHSATTNYENCDRLIVFSTSAPPFEAGHAYTKFAAYTLLNFAGDFTRAASELARRGYGSRGIRDPPLPATSPYAKVRLPGSHG